MHRYEHRSVTQLCVARSLMYDKLVNVSKIKECISDKSHNIGVIRIEQLCTFRLIFSNKSTRHLHFSKFHCNFYVSFFFNKSLFQSLIPSQHASFSTSKSWKRNFVAQWPHMVLISTSSPNAWQIYFFKQLSALTSILNPCIIEHTLPNRCYWRLRIKSSNQFSKLYRNIIHVL